MSSLAELLERVKAATGADRELDFQIHIVLVDDVIWPVRDRMGRVTNPNYRMSDYLRDFAGVINSDDQDFDFPRHTASIDAALALTERVLPGWSCGFDAGPKTRLAFVDRHDYADRIFGARYTAEAPSICLAILAATLSALNDQEPRP